MSDLRIHDLTVEYDSSGYAVRAIDSLSFEAPSGSLVVLLGPSGCGKSTLLSCLAGILRPTSGEISIGHTSVGGLTGTALTDYRRTEVGIVFQSFNLVPSLTALENVMAPLVAGRVPKHEARGRALNLLADMGLTDRRRHRPGDLSGGQQQRVAIARALAHDPPVVLADEPTAHLDYVAVENVLGLIRSLAQPGRVAVVATHDERLVPLADLVVEMVPKFADKDGDVEELFLGAGDVVFEQGSRGSRIYYVQTGEIEIVRVYADGSEHVLTIVGPDDYFGEMGPIFKLPRSATARAGTGTRLLGYTVSQFGEFVGLERLGDLFGRQTHAEPTFDVTEVQTSAGAAEA